jgi:hypothetical protein
VAELFDSLSLGTLAFLIFSDMLSLVWLFECVTREPTRVIAAATTLSRVRHFQSVLTVVPSVRRTLCASLVVTTAAVRSSMQ